MDFAGFSCSNFLNCRCNQSNQIKRRIEGIGRGEDELRRQYIRYKRKVNRNPRSISSYRSNTSSINRYSALASTFSCVWFGLNNDWCHEVASAKRRWTKSACDECHSSSDGSLYNLRKI